VQTKGFPTIKQFEKELGKDRSPAKQTSLIKVERELGYIEMEKQKRELAVEFAANQA
jgi:hypothetical protein